MQLGLESESLTYRSLQVRVQTYYVCELLTGWLICAMAVFSPWAFGTTEPWSIWTMNLCGYSLGGLLLVKLAIRLFTGLRSARCARLIPVRGFGRNQLYNRPDHDWLLVAAVLASGLVVTYCLLAAINARSTYVPTLGTFVYHQYVPWLPATLDSESSWRTFYNYLALALSFWALWDWLQTKSSSEDQGAASWKDSHKPRPAFSRPPPRLVLLLWVLTLSGGLLGLEGIVQRWVDCPKLLFLVKPAIHQETREQFASYAYRANAAQYFNLVWPACLGLWSMLSQSQALNRWRAIVALGSAAIMAACPIISSARGAAMVDLAMILVAVVFLGFSRVFGSRSHTNRNALISLAVFLILTFALGLGLGWRELRPRLDNFSTGLHERQAIFERAQMTARDYPVFGTGPGTFETVFQLYRASPGDAWPAQLHNDWLETRVTFGWGGTVLIVLTFLTILLRNFGPGKIQPPGQLVFLLWLALAGCLVQAFWDFPLQVYSNLFLVVIWCAVLFSHSRAQSWIGQPRVGTRLSHPEIDWMKFCLR